MGQKFKSKTDGVTVIPEIYKDFEITSGYLDNGEYAYEAYRNGFGLFRKTREQLEAAIDSYSLADLSGVEQE